jgi:hypothetical protein
MVGYIGAIVVLTVTGITFWAYAGYLEVQKAEDKELKKEFQNEIWDQDGWGYNEEDF